MEASITQSSGMKDSFFKRRRKILEKMIKKDTAVSIYAVISVAVPASTAICDCLQWSRCLLGVITKMHRILSGDKVVEINSMRLRLYLI